jgi:hypothetical protein
MMLRIEAQKIGQGHTQTFYPADVYRSGTIKKRKATPDRQGLFLQ